MAHDDDTKDSKKPATDEVDDDWDDEEEESDAAASNAEDDADEGDDEGDDSADEDPTTIYRPNKHKVASSPAPDADDDSDDDAEDSDDDDDDEDSDDERESDAADGEAAAAAAARPDQGSAVERAASRAAQAHDHGLMHVAPIKLLFGVFGALTVLTIATVAVTSFDLGSQGNFIVAMIIATVKAGLVMAFFMHLVWDKKFNLTVFLSSFLFALLFLSISLADRSEYQTEIDQFELNNPVPQPEALAGEAAPAGAATPAGSASP